MFTEPRDIDAAVLARLLERHWGLRSLALGYVPVGFGSHHWLATDGDGARHFVRVDDLEAGPHAGSGADTVFTALDRAFQTAAVLRRDAGLEFVVATLPDAQGHVIVRFGDRYAVSVAPFVEGLTAGFGDYETHEDRRRMGTVIGRIHAASERVPPELPRRDDLAIPARPALEEALADLRTPWPSGPYGEPARALLRERAPDVERRLLEHDELAVNVRQAPDHWVVTHGEPHRANVILDARGGVHLVDWDTTLVAPRERDLRMVLDQDLTGWDEYTAEAGAVPLRREVLGLYHEWWNLAEIAIYVAQLRARHDETEDTLVAWESLTEYLR